MMRGLPGWCLLSGSKPLFQRSLPFAFLSHVVMPPKSLVKSSLYVAGL